MAEGHLLFVWTPAGYELREREGEVPPLGAVVEVEQDGETRIVTKLAPSPLPGDRRRCAYLGHG